MVGATYLSSRLQAASLRQTKGEALDHPLLFSAGGGREEASTTTTPHRTRPPSTTALNCLVKRACFGLLAHCARPRRKVFTFLFVSTLTTWSDLWSLCIKFIDYYCYSSINQNDMFHSQVYLWYLCFPYLILCPFILFTTCCWYIEGHICYFKWRMTPLLY